MGKGNKQYYEFSNYIEETNNEHDSKNKIKIFIIVVILSCSSARMIWPRFICCPVVLKKIFNKIK